MMSFKLLVLINSIHKLNPSLDSKNDLRLFILIGDSPDIFDKIHYLSNDLNIIKILITCRCLKKLNKII